MKIDGVRRESSLSVKGRLLLAYLAIHSGRPVSTHRITEDLFGDSLAADPHSVLKKTVQRVRRALGEQGSRLTSPAPRMLRLDLEGVQVDWALFHRALHKGDVESLQRAVLLHARPFLEDIPLPWAVSEQRTCLLRRQKALEDLFQQAMKRADWEQAGSSLSQMLTFELPDVTLNEELWRVYFEAQLQQEEFGKIRRHYLHLQTFLERMEGRLPELQTRAFWEHLPRSVRLQTTQSKKGSRKPALFAQARLLSSACPLIGREGEIEALIGAFDRARLVTIVGVGGVGKTRLAIQAGQEIAAAHQIDAAFFDLTSCARDNVLPFVAHTLGLHEEATTPLVQALQEFLAHRRLLLLWDNCEHCIEEVAELALGLLRHCPQLRLLLTSRESLRIEGEQVFPLAPLALPKESERSDAQTGKFSDEALARLRETAAVRLFVERAAASHPGFRWTSETAEQVSELCRLVDGLPLGIEIVASQVACVPLQRIVTDLSRDTLKMGHLQRGVSPRHRTLQAALDYSYGMLNAAEQTLLRRLSVFSGGWTLEAAEEVCADDSLPLTQIAPALSGLVSKSLAVLQLDAHQSSPYHFLETIRLFSVEKLQETGEERPMRAKHGDYFHRFCRQTHNITRIEQSVPQILAQKSNIYAAIQGSLMDPNMREIGADLCRLFGEYWVHTGLVREGLTFIDAMLKLEPSPLILETQAHLHLTRVRLASRIVPRNDPHLKYHLERALEGYCALNNRLMEYEVYFQLAGIAATWEEGQSYYRQALSGFRAEKMLSSVAHTLLLCGYCTDQMGEHAQADAEFREGLQVAEAGGYTSLRALAWMFLGYQAINQGDFISAEKHFTESLTFYQNLGSGWAIRQLTFQLGDCKRRQGDVLEAKALLSEGIRLSLGAEDFRGYESAAAFVAPLLVDLEDGETALFLYENLCHLTDPLSSPFQKYHQEKSVLEQHLTVALRQKIQSQVRLESLEQLAEYALEALQWSQSP